MMLYRAAPKPATEVAADVGATHVLSASVRREGDAVRFSLELVDARSDRVLSENYNRTLSSALTLQSEVALQVRAAVVGARFAVARPAGSRRRRTPKPTISIEGASRSGKP